MNITKRRLKRIWRKTVAILSCIAIFMTTYAMVLPVITLDEETAAGEPGIVLEEKEDSAEAAEDRAVESAETELSEEAGPSEETMLSEEAESLAEAGPSDEAGEETETEAAGQESGLPEESAEELNTEEASEETEAEETVEEESAEKEVVNTEDSFIEESPAEIPEESAAEEDSVVVQDSETEEAAEDESVVEEPAEETTEESVVEESHDEETAEEPAEESAAESAEESAAEEQEETDPAEAEEFPAEEAEEESVAEEPTEESTEEESIIEESAAEEIPAEITEESHEEESAAEESIAEESADENSIVEETTEESVVEEDSKEETEESRTEESESEESKPEESKSEDSEPEESETEDSETEESKPEESEPEDPETVPAENAIKEYKVTGEDYAVTVYVPVEAQIPAEAELRVKEIVNQQFDDLYSQTEEALGTRLQFARFFDIGFYIGEQEFEPQEPVKVIIETTDAQAKEAQDADALQVVHIKEDEPEPVQTVDTIPVEEAIPVQPEPETSASEAAAEQKPAAAPETKAEEPVDTVDPDSVQICFEAGGFSVYGIVYTVDFVWEVDGKTYEFQVAGGGFVSLESIIEALGVAVKEENESKDSAEAAREFVADVSQAEFSNPDLVWVGKIDETATVAQIKDKYGLESQYSAELTEEQIAEINEQTVEAGDWALISLIPFVTEESLTITMNTGEVFTIKVTDAQDPLGLDGQTYEIVVKNSGNEDRALSPVNEDETINGVTYQFLNDASISSGSNLAWKIEYDAEAFGTSDGYYLSSGDQYLKIVGTDQNDTTRTVTLVANKEEATPIAIQYDQARGKYSFSNDPSMQSGFLCYFNNDYFGVSGTASNNAWMELRNPDSPTKPGYVSPWDVLGDGIEIKLYDYSGTVGSGWNSSNIDSQWAGNHSKDQWRSGWGVNNGRTLLFTGSGFDTMNGDPYNFYTGQNPQVMQGIVVNHLGEDGYPELTRVVGNKGASLGYLFGAGGQDGVTAYTGADGNGLAGLLRKNEQGYYYFSSEKNYATLVDDNGNIGNELLLFSESYDKDSPSVNARKIGFFPFDPYRAGQQRAGEEKGPNQSPYNHQFGMTMEADFVLPPNGYLEDGTPMTFTFSGDDDVWVFIDDVLVLDLGGVHQPLTGTINFADGGYSQVVDATMNSVGGGVTTVGSGKTLAELFAAAGEEYDDSPYSTHTIKFFYLERGGCDSNCTLEFNLVMYKTVTLAKELRGLTDEERLKYADTEFDCELVVDGVPYTGSDTIRYDFMGNVIDKGFQITDGKVKLKHGEKVQVIGLSPKSVFYAAEENTPDMAEFYEPKAERYYLDENKVQHEEEITLHAVSEPDSWRTETYATATTDEIMFTNTLREKNLDIEKEWADGADKHSGDEVGFRIVAKIKVGDQLYDYTDIISALYSDALVQDEKILDVLGRTYTLSEANGWKARLEHLPAINNTREEIFYEVVEVNTADGYSSSVTGTGSHNIDVVKILPADHEVTDDVILFRLKKGSKYYNATAGTWATSAANATVHELSKENDYTCRFHDMPGVDDDPAGEYSYELVEPVPLLAEGGLSIFDHELTKHEILNTPFGITVQKIWDPAELANENVPGRKVEVTLGRYILMDIEGNLTIRKTGVPAGADFRANYTVKNSETGEIFGVYPYVPGGITVDVPAGSYTVTETILQDDDTYTHTHGSGIQSVTIADGGSAVATFTSEYEPIMGQMTIKSVLTDNDTGVSFDNVRYEVYDIKGNLIRTVQFSDASAENGYTFDIKLGSYIVKETDLPETPQHTRVRLNPKKPENGNRQISVIVKEEAPGEAEFHATYLSENNPATLTITRSNGGGSQKTWDGFSVGDIVRITYRRNNGETINTPSLTGCELIEGPIQDVAADNSNGWNFTYHIDVKLTTSSAVAAFTNPGISSGWSAMDFESTTVERISSANTRSLRKNSSVRNDASVNEPLRLSGNDLITIDLPAVGDTRPVPKTPPEGKKYVEDTSFTYNPVVLSYGQWEKILSDLPSTDENGNLYYYYIKSVHEENMPGRTISEIQLDGTNILFSGADNNVPLKVKNTVPPNGSLKIRKLVSVDGNLLSSSDPIEKKNLTNGTYTFTIRNTEDSTDTHTVTITYQRGVVSAATVDGADVDPLPADGFIEVPDLPGDGEIYTITETGKPLNSVLTSVVREDGKPAAVVDNVVTVNVTVGRLGDNVAADAKATFTNNVESKQVGVRKIWSDDIPDNVDIPDELTVILSNGTEVILSEDNNWEAVVSNLQKIDPVTGEEIQYSWVEDSLPPGFYPSDVDEETENGVVITILTNSYSEGYMPEMEIKGKKVWDDGGEGRPSQIRIRLLKNGEFYKEITVNPPADGENPDEWPFKFTMLPVFNDDGSLAQYTIEEVLPPDYSSDYDVTVRLSTATYTAGTTTANIINSYTQDNELLSSGVDLGYVIIRHGQSYVVWTPRPMQEGELDKIKQAAVDASNQFSGIMSASGTDLTIISGVPRTVRVGKKEAVSVYMKNGNVWVSFLDPSAQSDIVYGCIPYTYTVAGGEGGGTITNIKKETEFEFSKVWIDEYGDEMTWNQDLQFTLSRNKQDGTKDEAFSLVYNVDKTTVDNTGFGTAEFTAVGAQTTDPKLKLTVSNLGGKKKYSFSIEHLPYYSTADGKYTYYVEETNAQLTAFLPPEYSDDVGSVITNREKPKTIDVSIRKTDKNDVLLPGVVFTLQKKEGDVYQNIMSIKNDDQTLKYPDVGGVDATSQFTTNGEVHTITGLCDGEYRLIEESAPAGYVIVLKEIDFTIDHQTLVGETIPGRVTFDEDAVSITIINEPGASLPNTGGSGTNRIYLCGIMLTGFACAGLVMRRRRSKAA